MKLSQLPGALWRAHTLAAIGVDQLQDASADQVPVVVSFTSIPSRLPIVHLTVRSILAGTRKPEKVVLWLNDQLASSLPDSLAQLLGARFEIRYVAGTSSHRKLVHSLQAFPDKIVVTCDDDMMYDPRWLEYLYDDHLKFPQDVIANECRAIAYSEGGEILPYRYWYREAKRGVSYDALLPIGFGGVLYPPACLHHDVCDKKLYLKLTPKADDLWFKAMSYMQGTRSRRASRPVGFPTAIVNSQGVALRSTNVKQDGNRAQWLSIAQHYALPAFLPFALDFQKSTAQIRKPTDPIDAVITWVDGADPQHAAKLTAYLSQAGQLSQTQQLAQIQPERPTSALATRFDDAGELGYCVASLLKFAPWLRRIHIVTDAQTPALMHWIAKTPFADKINLVDHKDIFAGNEHYLPTFNTRSITSLLWKIPGLADQFIFLNDDFIVIRPVQPEDFFREKKLVLRGSWRAMLPEKISSLLSFVTTKHKDARAKYLLSQKLSARLMGFQYRYFQLRHDPHPMRVQNLRAFFDVNPQLLEKNIGYKLRSRDQFTIESFAAHLALQQSEAEIETRPETLQIKPASQSRLRIKYKLKAADRNKSMAFVCVQSMDKASVRVRDLVFAWLRKRIGTLEV